MMLSVMSDMADMSAILFQLSRNFGSCPALEVHPDGLWLKHVRGGLHLPPGHLGKVPPPGLGRSASLPTVPRYLCR